ncbi:MAG: phosphoglycerate kinase [Phycisphaerales bacterium]|jgi:phosphoglycerate kinase|nr:phosphoglycerate kinase [Phycisphaerales bacterium]
MKQTIEDVNVAGKRVLLRVDFNVPLRGGSITDDRRIEMALPSIKSVLDRGGSLTLMSHLGRPKGKGEEPEFSLEPVATRLSELLGKTVHFGSFDQDAEIVLLENLRFNAGEKEGDEAFASSLAAYGDIYCNDAFGTAHRTHASMFAVPKAMEGKPRVAGLLLANELQYLDHTIRHAEKPFVAVLGGAKVSDKMDAINHLLGKVDTILIGGAMAYTFLVASGEGVGKSLVERDRINEAKEMLDAAAASPTDLLLPHDHVCAKQIAHGTPVQVVTEPIPQEWMGVDIGPETQATFTHKLLHARTIVWNGPMGVFETQPFDVGTRQIAEAIAKATDNGAVSIVGGGDSASAIAAFELESQITHISTGGGASLQMLEGKSFKSVEILDNAL